MRMLASGHWTGDLILRMEAVLTVFGGILVVFGSSLSGRLIGFAFLVTALIAGAGLCWVYVRAEEAGDAWDPAEDGAPPLRWADLRPKDVILGIVLVGVVIVSEILLRGVRA